MQPIKKLPPYPVVPRFYGHVGRDWYTGGHTYAWFGLHWLLRAWRWWGQRRWVLERLGRQYGVYCLDEGAIWESGAWCAPMVLHRNNCGNFIINPAYLNKPKLC